ncbi:MAG TPA: hypothetical protein PKY82_16680 [Pyrinomonadaceae bacterium]|nr:hypothetical protein [Pyrinomonadaceae bacterium]
MNINKFLPYFLFSIFLLSMISIVKPQDGGEGATTFSNGVTIALKSQIVPSDSNNEQFNKLVSIDTSTTKNGKYYVHRIIADKINKIYIGYDIELTPQKDEVKYQVSIKPISINPNSLTNKLIKLGSIDVSGFTSKKLLKYPDGLIINNGDTISLEILENPQTKSKFMDYIKITNKRLKKFGTYFPELVPASSLVAKDFSINDIDLRLWESETFLNDKKIATIQGISGSIIYVYIPQKGRFLFSLSPHTGYDFQKIAVADDEQITFNFGGDKYKITSKDSIIPAYGKWNLWVMHDPNYKPNKTTPEFGSADDIKYLFKKDD